MQNKNNGVCNKLKATRLKAYCNGSHTLKYAPPPQKKREREKANSYEFHGSRSYSLTLNKFPK